VGVKICYWYISYHITASGKKQTGSLSRSSGLSYDYYTTHTGVCPHGGRTPKNTPILLPPLQYSGNVFVTGQYACLSFTLYIYTHIILYKNIAPTFAVNPLQRIFNLIYHPHLFSSYHTHCRIIRWCNYCTFV
jgi:hypothetical protein